MYNESFLIVNLENDYSIIAYKKKEDISRYNVELKLLKNSNMKKSPNQNGKKFRGRWGNC